MKKTRASKTGQCKEADPLSVNKSERTSLSFSLALPAEETVIAADQKCVALKSSSRKQNLNKRKKLSLSSSDKVSCVDISGGENELENRQTCVNADSVNSGNKNNMKVEIRFSQSKDTNQSNLNSFIQLKKVESESEVNFFRKNGSSDDLDATKIIGQTRTISKILQKSVKSNTKFEQPKPDINIRDEEVNITVKSNINVRKKRKKHKTEIKTGVTDAVNVNGRQGKSNFINSDVSMNDYNDTNDCVVAHENVKTPECKNAFDVMMDSRHKIIGRNSPGKELEVIEVDTDMTENRQTLSARKLMLKEWASSKGGLKRKIEDVEKQVYINRQLERRAKRMKKMLSINSSDKTRCKRVRAKGVMCRKLDSGTDSSDNERNQTCQSLKLNFIQMTQREDDNLLEIDSEDCKKVKKNVIRIKMFSPQVFKRKRKLSVKDGKVKNYKERVEKLEGKLLRKGNDHRKHGAEEVEANVSSKLRGEKKLKFTNRSSEIKAKTKSVNVDVAETLDGITPERFKPAESKGKSKKIKGIETARRISNRKHKGGCEIMNAKLRIEDSDEDESVIALGEDSGTTSLSNDEDNTKPNNIKMSSGNFAEAASDFVLLSSNDDDSCCSLPEKGRKHGDAKKSKKNFKIAPVFLKASPKPKLDPAVVEARKQFLLSGVPESLRKIIDKQQDLEDVEYNVFPSVSHVQQRTSYANHSLDYWALPQANLNYSHNEIQIPKLNVINMCSLIDRTCKNYNPTLSYPVEKLTNLKPFLQEIKETNPEYPVFKSFRLLQQKCSVDIVTEEVSKEKKIPKTKKRGRKSKTQQLSNGDLSQDTKTNSEGFSVWTEKFKARNSEDIVGNYASTLELKNWLQTWLMYSREIKTKKAKSRQKYSSSSEFDSNDDGSRDSVKTPSNAVILTGPHGCGKTMTIYALCNELRINVLELNASSKRTGKRLLQELQEATQSHQVRKNEVNVITSLLPVQKFQEDSEEVGKQKMCLLLVEDVDVVFDQDEGFLSALNQMLATSKRPVVLVTSDLNCVHLQKFIVQYPVIRFKSLSASILTVWLRILCLLEGLNVTTNALEELLEWNVGDMRCTLLQLQFWAQSGGCVAKDTNKKVFLETHVKRRSSENVLCDDEMFVQCNSIDSSKDCVQDVNVHPNCVGSFLNFTGSVPHPLHLDCVWWNLQNNIIIGSDKQLEKLYNVFETCALSDSVFSKVSVECNAGSYLVSPRQKSVKDGLELMECVDVYDGHQDFANEWTGYLLNGRLEMCGLLEENKFNMGLPTTKARRRHATVFACESKFVELVSASCHTDRRAFALDYFPVLRTVARSEAQRSAMNQKRGNRFYSYLRTLGFNYADSVNQTACDMFSVYNNLVNT